MKPSILLLLTIMMFYMLLNQGMVFLMIFLIVEQVLTTLFSFKQVSTLKNMFSDKLSLAYEEHVGDAGLLDHDDSGVGDQGHGHLVERLDGGHASDAAPDDGVV